jgi:hypothetical protein
MLLHHIHYKKKINCKKIILVTTIFEGLGVLLCLKTLPNYQILFFVFLNPVFTSYSHMRKLVAQF